LTRANRQRLKALVLPLPILLVGALILRMTPPGLAVKTALNFPGVCAWYFLAILGFKSMAVSIALGLGYWYLLLSLASYAVFCGRDRISRALLICSVATTVVVAAVVLLLGN
jgi:hypothetical protein